MNYQYYSDHITTFKRAEFESSYKPTFMFAGLNVLKHYASFHGSLPDEYHDIDDDTYYDVENDASKF